MKMLSKITKGKIVRPALILVYGPGGIGKSTWASKAPNPLFIGAEQGTDLLDTSRLQPKDYEEFLAALKELLVEKHDYRTLVIDSIDWVEPLIFKFICQNHGKDSIEKAAGGYGKGYLEAMEEWLKVFGMFNDLRNKRGMNIILLAHPESVTITNPETQTTYQRYELKLHKKSKMKFMEYVDALFFANFQIFSRKEGDQVKSLASESRVLHGKPNPLDSYDAKNRYGLKAPVSMDMPWDDFMELCEISPKANIDDLVFLIQKMIPIVKDEDIQKKATETLEKSADNEQVLIRLRDRLQALTEA